MQRKKIVLTPPIPYIDFIPPKLVTGEVWYISYSCIYPPTGKMRRIRIKLNRIASLPERKRVGRKIIADLSIKLQRGWNPFTERIAPKAYALMFETLDKFLAVKTKDNRPDTVRGYTSYVKIFKKWLLEHGFDESSYVCSFTESDAIDFMDDRDLAVSARTSCDKYLCLHKLRN